jgi:hypothetical protein
MTDAWAIVIAASIPVLATGIGWVIKLLFNLSKTNRDDHNKVMEEMQVLTKSVKKVGKKLDKHIDWHMNEK